MLQGCLMRGRRSCRPEGHRSAPSREGLLVPGNLDPAKATPLPGLRLPLPWRRQPWEVLLCRREAIARGHATGGGQGWFSSKAGSKTPPTSLQRCSCSLHSHEWPGQQLSPSSTRGVRGERSCAGGRRGTSAAPGEPQEPPGRAGAGGGGGRRDKGPFAGTVNRSLTADLSVWRWHCAGRAAPAPSALLHGRRAKHPPPKTRLLRPPPELLGAFKEGISPLSSVQAN